jgi:small conductance mechanosensitive channel
MKERVGTFYDTVYQWLITWGPKIVIALLLFIIGQWLIRLLRRWLNRFIKARRFDSVRPFLQGLIAILLQVLLVLMIMQILGIRMTIFAAVITALGVAAGFALSGTLQNFASGVLILALRPYKIGDILITQGQEGVVQSIQLFYTIIISADNKTIIVPNGKLSNEIIINLRRKGNRRIDIELKFSYAIDIESVKSIIRNTILSSQSLLTDPSHRIAVSSLEPDGYKLLVNAWTSANGFNEAKYELQERIMQDLKEGQIKLPGM